MRRTLTFLHDCFIGRFQEVVIINLITMRTDSWAEFVGILIDRVSTTWNCENCLLLILLELYLVLSTQILIIYCISNFSLKKNLKMRKVYRKIITKIIIKQRFFYFPNYGFGLQLKLEFLYKY